MSDADLRALHRTYLSDNASADIMLFMLDRAGIKPTWDWLAGGVGFYKLPLKKKVTIFLEKWPLIESDLDPIQVQQIRDGTTRLNNRVIWTTTHPETPGVSEILDESLGDLAYYYGQKRPPNPWTSFSAFIADEVVNAHHYIFILRHYRMLPG